LKQKKKTNPTPYSPITYFIKENNPSIHQTHSSFPMKLLKALNNLTTQITLMQLLKIDTTAHGCVRMAHNLLNYFPHALK
jgi:hypothetical protein